MRSIVTASSVKSHGSRAPEGNLFASIQFTTRSLQSWKVAFPHPSASPACYTGALLVKYPLTVAAADVEEWDWISTFTCVEHLEADTTRMGADRSTILLAAFYGFFPSSGPSA